MEFWRWARWRDYPLPAPETVAGPRSKITNDEVVFKYRSPIIEGLLRQVHTEGGPEGYRSTMGCGTGWQWFLAC